MKYPEFVVVVVPDIALQRSLVFALESDGHQVKTFETWQAASSVLRDAMCFIVDQKIVTGNAATEAYVRKPANRAIVLNDDPAPYQEAGIPLLTKPLTGMDVLAAVNRFKVAKAVSGVPV